LKPNLRISIQTLLQAGKSQRGIGRVVGVDPRTVRWIAREAKCPGWPPAFLREKLSFAVPGEESQVDFGEGALTRLPMANTVGRIVRDDAQVLREEECIQFLGVCAAQA
jgi:hypothetical protein